MTWDPGFVDRSPMLAPLREITEPLRAHTQWPSRGDLQRLLDARQIATVSGARLHLVAHGAGAAPYEMRIAQDGAMGFREGDWHDFFNLLAWIAFPQTKAALNAAHIDAMAHEPPRGNDTTAPRGRTRDALTLFDENGAIVISRDVELLEDIRDFRWKRLFVDRRERVRTSLHVWVVGHALWEKALRPYVGMTAHALLLDGTQGDLPAVPGGSDVDAIAAQAVSALETPRALSPLPVLGIPGWWAGNEDPGFYDDRDYFRPGRRRA